MRVAGQAGLTLTVPADDVVDFRVLIVEDDLITLGERRDMTFTLTDTDGGLTATGSTVFVTGSEGPTR